MRKGFCRFTIRSRTSFTFPIQRRRPPRNVARRATAPSPFGATSPRQAPRSEQRKSLTAYFSRASLTQVDDASPSAPQAGSCILLRSTVAPVPPPPLPPVLGAEGVLPPDSQGS